MRETFVLVLILTGSYLATALFRNLALRKQWFDIPNSRSSHKSPVPNSGGIGFVLVMIVASIYFNLAGIIDHFELTALLMVLPVAALGMLDDFMNLKVSGRISVHLVSSFLAVSLLGGLPSLQVFSLTIDFGWMGYLIGVLGLIWLINLYNFMDGIDGLGALEALFVCAAGAFFCWHQNDGNNMFLLLGFACAVSGFLFINLPPAKIFMGDVGSNVLGLSMGILGLITIADGTLHIWSWAILLGVFIVDSTLTLFVRFNAGEIWYYAHRSHAYQHAAQQHSSHGKVDLCVIIINLVWLFPLAWISLAYSHLAMLITVVAYAPLVVLGRYYKAGIALE